MRSLGKFLSSSSAKIIVSIIYALAFHYCYIHYLNLHFNYSGFDIITTRTSDSLLFFTTLFFCVAPTIFFRGIKNISSFLCIFIYFLLYVPIIVTYYFSLAGDIAYLLSQYMMFAFGMSLLFCADRVDITGIPQLKTTVNPFKLNLWLCVLISTYTLYAYRSNLQFVSFEEVYDFRKKNSELGEDTFTAYISGWLFSVVIPICLGYGFFSKKRIYVLIASAGCLVIYISTAAKAAILMPFLTYGIYWLFSKFHLKYSFFALGLLLSILIFSLSNAEFNMASSIILMRTIGNGGDLTRHYHDFFQQNPLTYYSHINIIRTLFAEYPYGTLELGQVVGKMYFGADDLNANANFWATDGYAAAGNFGILLSSLFLFAVFIMFNGIAKHYNKVFLIIVLSSYMTSFLNASLFQSLLTGGAILVFIFLSFSKARGDKFLVYQ